MSEFYGEDTEVKKSVSVPITEVEDHVEVINSGDVENKVTGKVQQQSQSPVLEFNKSVVFALQGEKFSQRFMQCWMEVFTYCFTNGIRPFMSFSGDTNPVQMRNSILGGSMTNGMEQRPFMGKLDYDYIMWISSDTLFKLDDFKKMMENIEKHDIVSGISRSNSLNDFEVIRNMDISEIKENGKYVYLTNDHVKEAESSPVITADYVDLNFMMMKQGVMETMQYPWFTLSTCTLIKDKTTFIEHYSPEMSFCQSLKKKGFQIMVDTSVVVGREKNGVV